MKLTEAKLKQLIEETLEESRLRRMMGRPKPKNLTPAQVKVNELKEALKEFEKLPIATTSPYDLSDSGDGKLNELQSAISELNNSDFYTNLVKRNPDNSFISWNVWDIDREFVKMYYSENDWDWDEKTIDEQTDLVFDDYLRIYEQNKHLDTQISGLIHSYEKFPNWASENQERFDTLLKAMKNLT